ncbi:uncharacterized protein LOC120202201 [Hibiscus syriacus]|uniref:uncharacterized protein LOC120202201 n=1 Tax=Hibiscus syriacus TaxID=106335 RepID=UPI00192446E8|nr:uncharacterized protein LOC120202201 [Hibiscus syriacus]
MAAGSGPKSLAGQDSRKVHWTVGHATSAILSRTASVKAVEETRKQVYLKDIKQDGELKGFVMFMRSRLSVLPVSEKVWEMVCELGNAFQGDGFDIGKDDAEV